MKLKNWVVNVILFMQFILIFLSALDCNDLKVFIISKVVILILITINTMILDKYTDMLD